MSRDTAAGGSGNSSGGTIDEIAARYGVGRDTVEAMLRAVVAGGGGMAQFNIVELGGSGQWMRGGMTMVGSMFDNELRAKVDRLATELATLYFDPPFTLQRAMAGPEGGPAGTDTGAPPSGAGQAQWQGSGSFQSQSQGTPGSSGSARGNWWPDGLGHPSAAGGQNDSRYAYFPSAHRLALQRDGGAVELYDTTGYDISGVSQAQGGLSAASFTGPQGTVPLDRLPRVGAGAGPGSGPSEADKKPAAEKVEAEAETSSAPETSPAPRTGSQDTSSAPAASATETPAAAAKPAHSDVFDALERLGTLKEKGILSEAEFAEKKRELLARL